MKFKHLLVLLTFLAVKSYGQDVSKVFSEVKNVTVRNTGVIKKNNIVKGYFNFYEYDKVDRKTLLFKLNLLDENLNEIGTKEIEGPKDWVLISSGFDGNNFCFKFWDEKTKSYELKVYDQQANEINSLSVKDKATGMKATSFKQGSSRELSINENNGFVSYSYNDETDTYTIAYAGATEKGSWGAPYESDQKSRIVYPNYLNGNSEIVLTGLTKLEKGMYNTKTQNGFVANNTKTGAQLFDVSTDFDDDSHVVPINAILDNGKITVIGLNYKKNKTMTTPPDGLAFLEYDKTGKLLKSNFKTFDESLGKFLSIDKDGKLDGGYYLFIHDIVKTKANTSIIMAEKFKKPGGSGALSALGAISGGSFVGLQLENMVAIEIDKDGNTLQAQEIEKAKGSTPNFPSYVGFLSPYLLANWSNMMGWMDYRYTLKNEDASELTFSFVDYDRLDVDAKKTENFGQIKYKAGKFTTDKVAIKNPKATWSYILPAKAGHVIQVNYFKKEKKLSMDMIKLNN